MTADVELLPLPDARRGESGGDWANRHARACVARATAAQAAEIEALRAERDLFRDETITLVRQNGEWQARAERLAEALREVAGRMAARAKWGACDCGCPKAKRPVDAASVAWIRAAAMVRAAIDQARGKGVAE